MRGKEKTHIDQGADTQTLPPTPPPSPKKNCMNRDRKKDTHTQKDIQIQK